MVTKHSSPSDHQTGEPPKAAPALECEPWVPRIDTQPDFNPFANIETPARSPGATLPAATNVPDIRDPQFDTTPLQGTRDLSDPDSLTDVIAESRCKGEDIAPAKRSST